MATKLIDLEDMAIFMSMLIGYEIVKTFSHGEDMPVIIESWVVKIEPTLAGNIPKMAIQPKDKVNEQIFFIHLNKKEKIIFGDDNEIFFDFKKIDENLFAKKWKN